MTNQPYTIAARVPRVRHFSSLLFMAVGVSDVLAQTVYTPPMIYEPYTFTTVASGDPFGVAVDNAGNIYVGDADNSIIQKITPAGVVTTLAGLAGSRGHTDGTGNAARFIGPEGVAVDGAGNVYVAESGSNTIRLVTPAGDTTTFAGTAFTTGSADGTGSAAQFNGPQGVAADGAGNIYVADSYNYTIRKITPAGEVTTLAGLAGVSGSANGTGTAARFGFPMGVAVDDAGNVYVADTDNHTIRKITSAGEVTTLAGLAGTSGIADGTGNAARFSFPMGVAVDGAGNVYVADTDNQTIRKITPAGAVTTLAGFQGPNWPGFVPGANGTGSEVHFTSPSGIAVDGSGNVYVADAAVRKGVAAVPIPVPVITSGLTASVMIGTPFTYTTTASGSPTIFGASGLPNGLTVSPSTGVISGTPATAGYTPVGLQATGPAGSGFADLALMVTAPPPVITSATAATATAGTSFTYTITATASPTNLGAGVYFGAAGLPGGLAVDQGTGVINGTPSVTGSFSITLFADYRESGISASGTATLTLNVTNGGAPPAPLPTITSATAATATAGAFFTYAITATNSPTSYSATGLPGGLSINTSTGVISGTPVTAGSSSITVSAANAAGTGSATLTLMIASAGGVPAGNTPVISGITTASGTAGTAFTYTITASNSPTSYNATGLPSGLSINISTGAIGGTPTTVGSFSITISATNAAGAGSATLALTIVPASSAPVISGLTTASGEVGIAFTYVVVASNSPASYAASGLPAGLLINTGTGVISGTPTVAGSFSASLSAVNAAGTGHATVVFTISPSGTVFAASRLANISTRAQVGTGDQVLIAGFVVAGSKPLLVRGVGPSLAQFAVTGLLGDPQLAIYTGSSVIASNDNWGSVAASPQLASIFPQTGAFALPDGSKDAALLTTIDAGAHTAVISGTANATGVALVEVYDANISDASAHIVNISARAQVATGDGILIAGFIVAGDAPKTLLIRGIGPALAQFGISGALADPQLALYSGSTVVASNDNWGSAASSSQLAATFSQVGAFALADGSKDAALLVTLQPGSYTAQVAGINATSGIGLVEVYEVP